MFTCSLPRLTFLVFTACALAFTAQADDRERIEIRGRILLPEEELRGTVLIVVVNETDCVPFDLHADGRFELFLPIDAKASIRFEKDGYLSKDVLVDTRHALRTKTAEKKNKLVRFDVQLQPEPRMERMYAGPVGTITFNKGTGLMKVQYDRTLVPVPAAQLAARTEVH